MKRVPQHPPRIVPFTKYGRPLWFITFGTHNRQRVLDTPQQCRRFVRFGEEQALRGTAIGRYVIMPDHIHMFIRIGPESELGATIGFLKKALSTVLTGDGIELPHWQPGFFDHLLRSADSYADKWAYVRENPVRAGLVENAGDWPYAGEIVPIAF
jgi:putative transposase